jgi:Bacterial Ig-like domain (group 2).
MKKILYIILLFVLGTGIYSCSDDDNKVSEVIVSNDTISLAINETKQLTNNIKECLWTSTNSLIASVDNGLVKGNHAGSANIITMGREGRDTCCVIVNGTYNTYTEPYIVMNTDAATIKLKEKRTLSAESKDALLTYAGDNSNVLQVQYILTKKKLTSITVKLAPALAEEAANFLAERYSVYTKTDGTIEYINSDYLDIGTTIAATITSSASSVVINYTLATK